MSNPALSNNIKINIKLNIKNPHTDFLQFRNSNTHQDELCIGRKIENNKVNLLNLSAISTIKKVPVAVELMKPSKKSQSIKSQNTTTSYLINDNTNDQTIENDERKPSKPNKININNKSLSKAVNSSFHSTKNQVKKSRSISKKQQLQDLLQQLQKLTPEIKELLLKEKTLRYSPKNPSLSPKSILKKKKTKAKKTKKMNTQNKLSKNEVIKILQNPQPKNLKIEKNDKSPINNPNNCKIKKLILANTKKFAINDILKKQKEEENQRIKQERDNFLLKRNDEIRKINRSRFISKSKQSNSPRNRSMKPIYYQTNTPSKPLKKLSGKERREELGLSWLNELDEPKYELILEKTRNQSQEKSKDYNQINELPKKKSHSNERNPQELKNFIQIKQKQYKEQIKHALELKNQALLKKTQNLIMLKDSLYQKHPKNPNPNYQIFSQNTPQSLYKSIQIPNSNLQDYSPEEILQIPDNLKIETIKSRYINNNQIEGPPNMMTASFPNQISRIPTENEHLDERIEIEELEKSSFSERNYLSLNEFQPTKAPLFDEERLNDAANLIQRVWRGYKTRQLVENYLNYMLQQEEEAYLEYYPEEANFQNESSVQNFDLDLKNSYTEENMNDRDFKKKPKIPDSNFIEANINKKLTYSNSNDLNELVLDSEQKNSGLNEALIESVDFQEKPKCSNLNEILFDHMMKSNKEISKNSNGNSMKELHSKTHKEDNEVLIESDSNSMKSLKFNERKGSNSNGEEIIYKIETSQTDGEKNENDLMEENDNLLINSIKVKEEVQLGYENPSFKILQGFNPKFKEHIINGTLKNSEVENSQKDFSIPEEQEQYASKQQEISFDKNPNFSHILHYKEINENSKSLITVKDFGADYSDFIEKEESKISNIHKKNLSISSEANAFSVPKTSSFLRKPMEKSSNEFLKDQLMENLKNIESMTQTVPSQEKEKAKVDKDKQDLDHLKQEQLGLWYQMIENLKNIQETQSNPKIKEQIEKMAKFSEINIMGLQGLKGTKENTKSSAFFLKNKPLLQINIEDDNNSFLASDKVKNTSLEEHPSSLLNSLQQNLKSFKLTPLSNTGEINLNLLQSSNNKAPSLKLPSEELFDNMATLQNPITFKGTQSEQKASVYNLDPFQELAFKHKSDQKKPQNLNIMRGKVLEIRQEAEMKHMKQIFSPKSFENRKRELEKWVTNERNEFVNIKNDSKQAWLRTTDAIQKTKRDLAFMRKIGGTGDFIEYNMKFSFSQDDLLSRPSLLLRSDNCQPSDFIKKSEVRVFEDIVKPFEKNMDEPKRKMYEYEKKMEDPKKIMEDGYQAKIDEFDEANKKIYELKKKIGEPIKKMEEIKKKIDDSQRKMDESEKNFDKFDKQKERKENEKINVQKEKIEDEKEKFDGEINYEDEKTNQITKKINNRGNILEVVEKKLEALTDGSKSKDNEQLPISNEEMFEEFKETEESKPNQSEESLTETQRNNFLEASPERKKHHEVIKLDFFMDFQELDEELKNQQDSILSNKGIRLKVNERFSNIEEKAQDRRIQFQPSEQNLLISDNILEDLLKDMLEDKIFKLHKDNMTNILIKKNSINNLPHNKEFEFHFPKASEDYSLIKSQEFLKTDNSRILSNASSIIQEYLKSLKNYIIEIKDTPLGQIIMNNINTPLGFNPQEKLRFLHKNLYKFSALLAENVMIPYVDREIPRKTVIPIEELPKINEEIIKRSKFFSFPDEAKEDYFRLVFNSFNESLDYYRPYSIKGQPNFLKEIKNNKKLNEINEKNIEDVLIKAIGRTLGWSETLCGLLPDKEEKTMENPDVDVDMDFISHLREEKMGRMLAREVIESEGDWVNYEEEEIEIKLEICQLVWEEFLYQNVNDICKIIDKR